MTFGLDFDGTYTADPHFFRALIALCQEYGHRVVVVTARGDHRNPTAEDVVGGVVPVVRSYDRPKTEVVSEHEYRVDVWIDDEPWKIADPQGTP